MLDGLKKIVEGVSDIVEPLNPLVTNMTDKNKEIANLLLSKGYKAKEIEDFVDVSRNQLDEFIAVEIEVLKRMAEAS